MDSQTDKLPEERRDPYAALRFLDFRLLLTGRFITSFGNEMLSFAIAGIMAAHTQRDFIWFCRSVEGHPSCVIVIASGTRG